MPVLSTFREDGWYKATTLPERVQMRRLEPGRLPSKASDEGAKWMRRWRAQPPFGGDLFSKRLDALGIDSTEFLAILSESTSSIRARNASNPTWLDRLEEAFSKPEAQVFIKLVDSTAEPIFDLLSLAKPLMAWGILTLKDRIQSIVQRHQRSPFRREVVEQVFAGELAHQVLAILSKVAVLELNVARVRGALDGETPHHRYRAFVEQLGKPEVALAMMLEYPVLARQLVLRIEQWMAFVSEFLERLCSDWDEILRVIGPAECEPGFLKAVQMNAGDRHRGGRGVLIATFSSGFKLVYKPKSMAVDAHFQELLSWINQRCNPVSFRTLKVLPRGCYGWTEFVSAEACRTPQELSRFYERQGAYLALLYALEAVDFHSENIIASGENPVLIDLEAIFHPRLAGAEHGDRDSEALSCSVLSVGLLPWRSYSAEPGQNIDLSGLGGAAGQLTPHKIPYWEMVGTDEMKLSRRRMRIPAGANRPSLNEVEADPSEYAPQIEAGFTWMYNFMKQHREELLSPGGPLRRFADDEVRVIFRPTKTYGILLNESFHPDVMRDALDRELLFDRLWMAVEACPYLARIIPAEYKDLQRGDIPFFSTFPNSLHVWTSTNQCIPDLIDQPSLSIVEGKLRSLSEGNLSLQRWLIRASLATAGPANGLVPRQPNPTADSPQSSFDRDKVLGAACAVADRLESLAICWDESASWINLTAVDERRWSITPSLLDLYDGLPGIALFLAYVGHITGKNRYSDLAHKTCNTVLRRLEEYKSIDRRIGAFAGWGGLIYAFTHLGSLWQEAGLLDKAEGMIQGLPGLITGDEAFDIIEGSAGCIGTLIASYRQRRSPQTLAAAKACGEHLIANAKSMPNGVGWIIPKQTVPLAGFAHGAAGVAWALHQLYDLTGEEIFRKAAAEAIAYESTLFDPEEGNWRDLRTSNASSVQGNHSSMSAWCHGATGIGLSRLATLEKHPDDQVAQEVDTSLKTTIWAGLGHNHSLCHGDLGNIDLLLQTSRVLKSEHWNREAQRVASSVAQSIFQNEYRCGTPLNVDSPGLMTGLAGIGYGLLRVAEPERVPSVLTLQPVFEA